MNYTLWHVALEKFLTNSIITFDKHIHDDISGCPRIPLAKQSNISMRGIKNQELSYASYAIVSLLSNIP